VALETTGATDPISIFVCDGDGDRLAQLHPGKGDPFRDIFVDKRRRARVTGP